MGKVVIQFWECDICRSRYEKEDELKWIGIPVKKFKRDGSGYRKGFVPALVCDKCQNKMWDLFQSRIADISEFEGELTVVLKPHPLSDTPKEVT